MEKKDILSTNIYLVASFACMAGIVIFSVIPTTRTIGNSGFRAHIFSYAILSLFLSLYFSSRKINKAFLKAALLAGFYGMFVEIIQMFIPYRNFELMDILVNFTGAFLVFFAYFIFRNNHYEEDRFYTVKNKMLFRAFLCAVLSCLLLTIFSFIFASESKLILALIAAAVFVVTFRRINLGIYLSAFLIPLIPRLPEQFGTANFSIAELIVLVILFNWILFILIKNQFTFRKTKLDSPILIFLALTLISFFVSLQYLRLPLSFAASSDNLYPFKVLLNTFEYILLFYLIVNVLDKKDIRRLIYTFLASLMIISVIAVIQFSCPSCDLIKEPDYSKGSISNGMLEVESYPTKTLEWGHNYFFQKLFMVDSSKNFSIEGFVKIARLSESASAGIIVSCINKEGKAIEWISINRTNITNQWVRVTKEFRLLNETRFLKIAADTFTRNNTISGLVYFDNITLKQGDDVLLFETFDSWNNLGAPPSLRRASSTFNQPNILGDYIIMFIPLVLLLLFKYKSPLYLLVSIISLTALVFSFSRGAVAGFLAATALFFRQNKKTLRILVFSTVFFLIIIILQLSVISPIIDKGISLQGRFEIFKESLNLIKENPLFGTGLGTFRTVNNLEIGAENDIHHAHNIYLQIAVERGLIALLVFLALLFVFYRESLATPPDGEYLHLIKQALLIGITAVLIHGLVDYPFYNQRIALLFWMLVGIVVVISNKQ